MTQRDRQKDMDKIACENERWKALGSVPIELDISTYWLQEAKERGEREQRLKEAYERALESIYTQHCTMNHMENTEHEEGQISGLIKASNILKQEFSTLYPDTPAPKEGSS
ncbi:hypothetical protein NYE59_01580 [Paenibacillus sp. FSL L8-0323]|uniref:hypothetical protein n=1 Tax=Paenibacillus sp. FSL L8-0323 TaxID=2975330 RepID=UPI0030F642C1